MKHFNAPASQRYHAAWLEINARIQSRQLIQATYMTGVVVTLIIGIIPDGGNLRDPFTWRQAGIFLLPLLSLSVAMWIRHNDSIIGHLSAFCQALERLDDPQQTSRIPGWHDIRYRIIESALRYRRWSDIAFILVAFVATIPAFGFAFPELWGALIDSIANYSSLISLLAILVGLSSIAIVCMNKIIRLKIMNTMAFGRSTLDENKSKSIWGHIGRDIEHFPPLDKIDKTYKEPVGGSSNEKKIPFDS